MCLLYIQECSLKVSECVSFSHLETRVQSCISLYASISSLKKKVYAQTSRYPEEPHSKSGKIMHLNFQTDRIFLQVLSISHVFLVNCTQAVNIFQFLEQLFSLITRKWKDIRRTTLCPLGSANGHYQKSEGQIQLETKVPQKTLILTSCPPHRKASRPVLAS